MCRFGWLARKSNPSSPLPLPFLVSPLSITISDRFIHQWADINRFYRKQWTMGIAIKIILEKLGGRERSVVLARSYPCTCAHVHTHTHTHVRTYTKAKASPLKGIRVFLGRNGKERENYSLCIRVVWIGEGSYDRASESSWILFLRSALDGGKETRWQARSWLERVWMPVRARNE